MQTSYAFPNISAVPHVILKDFSSTKSKVQTFSVCEISAVFSVKENIRNQEVLSYINVYVIAPSWNSCFINTKVLKLSL
jgi:hypothetical protein